MTVEELLRSRELTKAQLAKLKAAYKEEKRKAYNRAYYQANRERLRAYNKTYYQDHREEFSAYCRAYYAAHKDIILANRKKVKHGTAADG